MKPRNKFQEQVFALSKILPQISEAQAKWAYRNCFAHLAKRTKKGIVSCLECGHSWVDKKMDERTEHCICPHCRSKLQIDKTRKRIFRQTEYYGIVTVCKGFQVVRFFYIQRFAKAGKQPQYLLSEAMQRWITPDGRHAIIARLKPMSWYLDTWNFMSGLEIRKERQYHNISPTYVYPCQKVIPELKRNGYKNHCYEIAPFDLFRALLTDNRAETLLKAGQTKLLKHFIYRNFRNINDYWASIKICIRNGYEIGDASVWCDYADLLRFFGKDLHSAKYVCPADLTAEHDRYIKQKKAWEKRQKAERARKKALQDEAIFHKMKSRFFGIEFSDGLIQIRMLSSVAEIMQEGDIMHHCVFANEYHLKPDSLILSASIDGKPVETVEFSLSKMRVIQSRGVCNKCTEHHEQIINLVTKNKRKIRQRMAA